MRRLWAPLPAGLRRSLASRLSAGLSGFARPPRDPDPERRRRDRRGGGGGRKAWEAASLEAPSRPPEEEEEKEEEDERRALSRRAMEQMRFLRRQCPPEEWPVWRLARGFGVSPETVLRVLRSRFVPADRDAQHQPQPQPRGPVREEKDGKRKRKRKQEQET